MVHLFNLSLTSGRSENIKKKPRSSILTHMKINHAKFESHNYLDYALPKIEENLCTFICHIFSSIAYESPPRKRTSYTTHVEESVYGADFSLSVLWLVLSSET